MRIAPASEKLFNVVVKVANYCPLCCEYCYIRPHNAASDSSLMPLTVVQKAIEDFLSLAGSAQASGPDGKTVKLTWHGGEPLLAGAAYFRDVLAIQERLIQAPYRCTNAITTNGVLINSEWIDIFRAGQFEVAVSLDGPASIHNKYRKTTDGTGSFDKVMAGIGLLQDAAIPFGIMAVVTPEATLQPESLLEFFVSHGLKNLNFIPYTTKFKWLPATDFTDFSIRLFNAWFDRDDPDLYIRDFGNLLARIFGRESNLCEYTNCFGNYLALDTNGDVYMCDLLIGTEQFLLGNICSQTFAQLLSSQQYMALKVLARRNTPTCRRCPFFLICTGGCMYRRYLSGKLPGRDIYCQTRRYLISHILTRLEEIDKCRTNG